MRKLNRLFSYKLSFCLLAVLSVSLGDEITSMTYAFTQVEAKTMFGISILMSSTIAGGLLSAPLSTYLFHKYDLLHVMVSLLILSGIIAGISTIFLADKFFFVVTFLLGCLGTIFWSSLSVLIPSIFCEKDFVEVNKLVQSIRSLGYTLASALAGALNFKFDAEVSMWLAVSLFFIASVGVMFF